MEQSKHVTLPRVSAQSLQCNTCTQRGKLNFSFTLSFSVLRNSSNCNSTLQERAVILIVPSLKPPRDQGTGREANDFCPTIIWKLREAVGIQHSGPCLALQLLLLQGTLAPGWLCTAPMPVPKPKRSRLVLGLLSGRG